MLFTLLLSAVSFAQSWEPNPEQQRIIVKATELYQPLAAEAGGRFSVDVKASQTHQVANASRDPLTSFTVNLPRGLLESDRLTLDGLRIVLCHEIGHLFGGEPLRENPPEWQGPTHPSGFSYLSGEGQADFYASAVCFRQMVKGENHRGALKDTEVPAELKRKCDESWGIDTEEALVCQRAALGGKNLLVLTKDFPISFSTPDRKKINSTLRGTYPSRQCRLDTYLAGALCKEDLPVDLNGLEQLSCPRPECWYVPDSKQNPRPDIREE